MNYGQMKMPPQNMITLMDCVLVLFFVLSGGHGLHGYAMGVPEPNVHAVHTRPLKTARVPENGSLSRQAVHGGFGPCYINIGANSARPFPELLFPTTRNRFGSHF